MHTQGAIPQLHHTLQVPGLYKIRYIGQTTVSSAAVRNHLHVVLSQTPHGQMFGLFLGAGSLLHCGKGMGR